MDWKLIDQYVYQTRKKELDKSIYLESSDSWENDSFKINLKINAVTDYQKNNTNSHLFIEALNGSLELDSSKWEIGAIDKNFSHLEGISFLNKNESQLMIHPELIKRISSPSIFYQKDFDDSRFKVLWQIDKSKSHYLNKKDGIWYPDNRVTNLTINDKLLILPELPDFSITDNREYEAASLNNISVKYEKNYTDWDIGAYLFHGSSSPSYFYQFTVDVTSADGNEITAKPGIKIIPTYFKELALALFGSKQFENSILKWEIGHRKDQSELDSIDLNETNIQLQWETSQYHKSHSLLHFFFLTYTNSKNDVSYKLAPFNFIYLLNYSNSSSWEYLAKLSKSLKYSTSRVLQLKSIYNYSDSLSFNFGISHFHSEDKDLINMYNEKHYINFQIQYLF